MPGRGQRGRAGSFYMAGYRGGSGGKTTADGAFGVNEFYGMEPGDVPYDMNVDPSQTVSMPFTDLRSGWSKYKGAPDVAGQMNSQFLLDEAMKASKNIADMEQIRAKKQYEDEMLAKAIVPLLQQTQNLGAIPSSVGTNYADIGNFLQASHGPLIGRFGGAVAFPQAQADIAQAQAQQVGFENARLADLARQPFVSPTARSQAMMDARIAGGLEGFSMTPQFESLLRYQQANKMAPPFSVGAMEERYEPSTGRKYVGPRAESAESVINRTYNIGGKEVTVPETVKSIKYYPGQTLDENVVGRIENPDPSYPRDVSPKSSSESVVDESGYISSDAEPYEIMQRKLRRLGVTNRGAQFQRPPYR